MSGRAPVTLFALPVTPRGSRRTRGAAAAAGELPDYDERMFQRLRALRRRLAAERRVPPYLIFGDRTLQELAAAKPTTPERLLGIRGIGEVKARDLGPAFLAEIAAGLAEGCAATGVRRARRRARPRAARAGPGRRGARRASRSGARRAPRSWRRSRRRTRGLLSSRRARPARRPRRAPPRAPRRAP